MAHTKAHRRNKSLKRGSKRSMSMSAMSSMGLMGGEVQVMGGQKMMSGGQEKGGLVSSAEGIPARGGMALLKGGLKKSRKARKSVKKVKSSKRRTQKKSWFPKLF